MSYMLSNSKDSRMFAAAALMLPLSALFARSCLPPWVFLWLISAAIFMSFKLVTLSSVLRSGDRIKEGMLLSYLFLWPGMDVREFVFPTSSPARPASSEWIQAVMNTAFGAALIWIVVRVAYPESPLLAGWVGMIGLIFVLHFGTFHLIALFWRRSGIPVQPLMNAPTRSSTLTEFWSRRWNMAFRQVTHDYLVPVLKRHLGMKYVTVCVFLFSGVVHEMAISLPAGAGFGLPTAYFLFQGAGVLFERVPLMKRWFSRHPATARMFVFLVVAAPVFWLFHPPFVLKVILPFLGVLSAF